VKKGNINPNLTQVSVLVPKLFLQHFDEAIEGFFQGRSEAIRRGMNLVLEEIQRFQQGGAAGGA
jgi:metal-responsive CopG/Arc/MetJ family transcriptional regulator